MKNRAAHRPRPVPAARRLRPPAAHHRATGATGEAAAAVPARPPPRAHRARAGLGAGDRAGRGLPDDLGPGRRVLAVHRRPRPAPDRRTDRRRRPVRVRVLRRPDRLGARDDHPRHQRQRDLHGQTRHRQVRHHQGLLPADDRLRLPHPHPRRPQGRVRAAVPRSSGSSPSPSGPACPPGSTPSPSAPSPTAGTASPTAQATGRAAVVFTRWLTLIRALVGSQRVGEHPVPFGPCEEAVVKTALQDLTGYPAAGRPTETTIPAAVALPRPAHRHPHRRLPVLIPAGLPGRHPAAARRPRPARLRSPGRPVRRTTPPSTSTGPPPSSRCPCPGWPRSATRPSASPWSA